MKKRTLRFRALDLRTEELSEPFELTHHDIKFRNEEIPIRVAAATDHFIFQQSTTLFDKKGVEIFEGDTVMRTYQDFDGENYSAIEKTEVSRIEWTGSGLDIADSHFGWEGEGLWNWEDVEVINKLPFENQ
jgi:uncharacterized phage protein (TIGR01671 family)